MTSVDCPVEWILKSGKYNLPETQLSGKIAREFNVQVSKILLCFLFRNLKTQEFLDTVQVCLAVPKTSAMKAP